MIKVKNTAACVVSIGGAVIIPPLGVGEVDPEHSGVQRLLARGVLLGAPTGDDPDGVVPETVVELKEALMARGIDFPENARKSELQALYDQTKAQ
ncbi:HeH/LEM domain-containing protein [Cupriavidus sp. D384]|uniref:HeH/LEM domain-containing protein n=1 Tax=Cupriavidus sp. D384 TaxID=1538095 RepID=UPI0008301154|nr:HeH/LEM domain-containing protein [Cupriavidus sp. D384]